jgi:hypothetical protein
MPHDRIAHPERINLVHSHRTQRVPANLRLALSNDNGRFEVAVNEDKHLIITWREEEMFNVGVQYV